MNLDEGRRKLTHLLHKRKILNNVAMEFHKGFPLQNQDMDVQQLIDYNEFASQRNEKEIKNLREAIYQAEKDILITYEEGTQ